jgi:hypothetical protein
VWYTRDELARDSEVLHLHWGVLYKSGVYAAKALCLTPGGLPAVRASEFSHANWALAQAGSIGRQKSAEGKVCAGQRTDQEGSSPSGARVRGAVSKGGGNASPARVRGRYGEA